MEDISLLFYSIQQDNPALGSYACLLRAISGSGHKRTACRFYLDELVDKNDYSKGDKEELVEGLVRASTKQAE